MPVGHCGINTSHWAHGAVVCTEQQVRSCWGFLSPVSVSGAKTVVSVPHNTAGTLHCLKTLTLQGTVYDSVPSSIIHCSSSFLLPSSISKVSFSLVFLKRAPNLSCRAQFIKQATLPRGSGVLKQGERQYHLKLWVHTKHSHSAGVDIKINSPLAVFQMA